jgi:hypothetical protein
MDWGSFHEPVRAVFARTWGLLAQPWGSTPPEMFAPNLHRMGGDKAKPSVLIHRWTTTHGNASTRSTPGRGMIWTWIRVLGRRSAAKLLTRDEAKNLICDLWVTLRKFLFFPKRDVLTVFGLGSRMFA